MTDKMMKEELLHKAIKIAQNAHRGQTDKYKAPYIGHVMRVMNYGKTLDEKIVGVLHDVVEDCPEYSIEYLKKQGFSDEILFAIECLSKTNPEESYDDFIKRIEQSPLAIAVKINDLTDNMDLKRVNKPLTEKDLKRFNKYLKAYHYLIEKY
ncbi:phosphohydrolase [Riemerella anatipestifer]|uniref:Phosphohydrolase n=1 Tax=Riemerella anatipestifer TaxID=34085 RepID=A0AAP6HGC6_RIEAN|nr:phosphohydrolase [Riemerella anatipestifer]MBT0548462.1 phosphohydrolase [Riemerella anatipestifer]MBT0555650.1 phosphohydrolase [Riemerella anatipestifer]MBT0559225.1 phosphohydrolase [Riemerella anatipestifer]MCD5967700.1 phosphohydrolase [Riemerella anatipestifer]MCO7355228.1 phosphohydrolase [Riemerella anatipestifer]